MQELNESSFNASPMSSDKKDESCEGFIDGDIIESFLDLDRCSQYFSKKPTLLLNLIFPNFRVSMTEVVGGLQRSDASGMKVIVIDLGSLSCSILLLELYSQFLDIPGAHWRRRHYQDCGRSYKDPLSTCTLFWPPILLPPSVCVSSLSRVDLN